MQPHLSESFGVLLSKEPCSLSCQGLQVRWSCLDPSNSHANLNQGQVWSSRVLRAKNSRGVARSAMDVHHLMWMKLSPLALSSAALATLTMLGGCKTLCPASTIQVVLIDIRIYFQYNEIAQDPHSGLHCPEQPSRNVLQGQSLRWRFHLAFEPKSCPIRI